MGNQRTWSENIKLDPSMPEGRRQELTEALDVIFTNPIGKAELDKLDDKVIEVTVGGYSIASRGAVVIGHSNKNEQMLREDGTWQPPTDLRLLVHELLGHNINGLDDRMEKAPVGGSIVPNQEMLTNVEYTNWFLGQLKDVPDKYKADIKPRLGYDNVINLGETASPQEGFVEKYGKAIADGKITDAEFDDLKQAGEEAYGKDNFLIKREGDWVTARAIDSPVQLKLLFNERTQQNFVSDYEKRSGLDNNTVRGFPDPVVEISPPGATNP